MLVRGLRAEELVGLIRRSMEDKKAGDPVILKVGHLTAVAEYFVICSGENDRHVRSITEGILDDGREQSVRPLRTEGTDLGVWALLDFGEVVVHVFQRAARDYYRLERLWSSDTPQQATGA